MVSGELIDNEVKILGIEEMILIWDSGSCRRARFGCWHTKRDSCFVLLDGS